MTLELRPPPDDATVASRHRVRPGGCRAGRAGPAAPLTRGLRRCSTWTSPASGTASSSAELMPAGLPVAGGRLRQLLGARPHARHRRGGAGVLRLPRRAGAALPGATLADFLDEALGTLGPPQRLTVDDVHEDRLLPGLAHPPRTTRLAGGDGARPTARCASSPSRWTRAWTMVDLRRREVGMGVAWGAHGPRTRLARHGWERIFGYAPPAGRRTPSGGSAPASPTRRWVSSTGSGDGRALGVPSCGSSPAVTTAAICSHGPHHVDVPHVQRREAQPHQVGLAVVADDAAGDERLHHAVRRGVPQRDLAAALVAARGVTALEAQRRQHLVGELEEQRRSATGSWRRTSAIDQPVESRQRRLEASSDSIGGVPLRIRSMPGAGS